MPYYRLTQERPRQAKQFLTVREIEDMVAAGATEVLHVEGLVITDAAREAAHDLGLKIRRPEPGAPALSASPAAQPSTQPQRTAPYSPVGGQPGAPSPPPPLPLENGNPYVPKARTQAGRDDPLVRAIVEAARAHPQVCGAALQKG